MDLSTPSVIGLFLIVAILLAGWRAIRPDSFKRATQRVRGWFGR